MNKNVLTINGHIIFTQLIGDGNEKEYARWISTGHNPDHGDGPEYSIQRFIFNTDNRGRTPVACDPYYRVYYRGFRISHIGGKDEFTTFPDAMACCQRHHYGVVQ